MTSRTLPRLGVALALLAFVVAPAARAQGYFGQNQVQYDRFDWQVIETEHFLVHYYPAEREAATDAARLAERSYARLSRILDHQFREKKPIILFASRTDFGQNNVTGDLGEGTGGVTELLRHRMLLPFTGDYASFEHVLTHEMVHEFQYDVYSRGHAGGGLQTISQVAPPLWFMEGMAEYLSIGPDHRLTDTWVRDAALNGQLPTIEQMTQRPDQYFPYRYGEALWEYVGSHWGDEVIGQILAATASVGIERAFKRELGTSLEDLSDEWREAEQQEFLPPVAELQRPRKFAQPLLTERKSGGQIFLAPALSEDGSRIAFLSNGSFLRGQVFIDLWLGDAKTGKRIKRLVKSTTDPNFEELRIIYSQSSFSPDGKHLAFTAQREGKDVLYVLDVKRDKTRRIDLPLEGVTSPAWSPDGRQLVFSGSNGGITDLYTVGVDGREFKRLTNDRYGDLQPTWSPDGRTIAFASDRGAETDFDVLRFSKWRVTLLDLATGQTSVVPGQAGLSVNPQWAPDGKSIAYVSDRTGVQNLFLYDFDAKEHYQLTNVVGGVLAITEYSPVISWARQADRLAFTYYEKGDYTVWSVDNPRMLKRQPYREPVKAETPAVIAARAHADSLRAAAHLALGDSTHALWQRSYYRGADAIRPSEALPTTAGEDTSVVTVAQLLDSAAMALPDTTTFKHYKYHVGFQPEYVARPSIGYAQDNYGRGVFGGTTIILGDLLGNHQLALSGEVNGRVSEARVFGAYSNLSRRLQYMTGIYQEPYYFLSGERVTPQQDPQGNTYYQQDQDLTRYIIRQVFAIGMYPLNRFTRFEGGLRFNNIDRTTLTFTRFIDANGYPLTNFGFGPQKNDPGLNFVALNGAYVSDNTLFGYTGPIFGRRYRFQIEPTVGSYRWIDYSADYRRYDAILFNFLTVATRLQADLAVGRDETRFPKYIGRPDFIRGYDRENYLTGACGGLVTDVSSCSAVRLLGSRVALANAELRFPLIRRFELGILPIGLPPLDGLFFYDAGLAWSRGQQVSLHRPAAAEESLDTRYPLTSYGLGLRLNLFNYAILRWDYAIPLDKPGRKGFWTWSLGPSF